MQREFGEGAMLGVIPWDSRIAATDRSGCSLVDLGQQDLLAPFRELQLTLEKPGTGYVFPEKPEKPGTGTTVHAAQKARLGTAEPVP